MWIPRNLDAPALFFLWDVDVATVLLSCTILGSILGVSGLIVGMSLGWLLSRSYAQLKHEGGRGLCLKLMYWYLPGQWLCPELPSSWREMRGR